MSDRIKSLVQAVRSTLSSVFSKSASGLKAGARVTAGSGVFSKTTFNRLVVLSLVGGAVYAISTHPPMQRIPRGEVGVRINQLTGSAEQVRDGAVIVVPGLHELRLFNLQDQLYRPTRSSRADGEAPFQSVEGLSLGVDLSIRYAFDPSKLAAMSKSLPENINAEIVEPAVQGVIYKAFTRYTVREIFSSKRAEIQQMIETELKPKLAADGILLRSVMMGKVDLPADYKRGMEKLLAEELESEKMRYTLELKDKQVKQTALEADADKIKREKAAEAAGNEQIIAARAQEEAMKHVLPFKQKQIEQRQFEAEAEKVSRIKTSEGTAQARVIEAQGEADSRRKLADAEAYRQDLVGKVASSQLERDGALLTKHPLLIQKTMADKLSDKISVIIAPPPADGGFIGSALLGAGKNAQATQQKVSAEAEAINDNKESQ
ncbi:SPFH domain-containing protein [Undibacterium sp. Ji49W]|uniref:SPFH domain-containing protein n=1 Tax=Undibacterium sp. Ji49W TaxID=3413040 RepID=UPI003BF416AF